MTLLDEFTSLEVEGSREAVMLARYPNILRKGMLFKWKRNARRQRWHLLPEEISKQHKEIPNWLRESLGLKKRGKLSADTVPLEVLHKFDNALYSRCCALQAEQGVNELLTSRSMITLMTRIVARYNSNISKHNIQITRQNKELLLAFKNGDVSAEDALQGKKKLLKKVLYMCIYIYLVVNQNNVQINTYTFFPLRCCVHMCKYIYVYICKIYKIKYIYNIYIYIDIIYFTKLKMSSSSTKKMHTF
jgi:hypothetical protein